MFRFGPVAGSFLFLLLYFIAAALYPGGSQHDASSKGFDWVHNYWCNLLNTEGLNGQPNSGKPYAIAGMVVLALSLLWFWVMSAAFFYKQKRIRFAVICSGALSVLSLTRLSSERHDTVVNIASLAGLLATFGVYAGVFKYRWNGLLAFGIINLLLVGLNNYLYYTKGMIYHLPLVQKITFLSWLFWIDAVSLRIANQMNRRKQT